MNTLHTIGAAAPGPVTPTNDEAPAGRTAQGFRDQGAADSPDFSCSCICAQAALTIEGEAYARAYLDRLHADAVQPGELAVLVSFLTGEMLNGACRLIEKALRGGRHA